MRTSRVIGNRGAINLPPVSARASVEAAFLDRVLAYLLARGCESCDPYTKVEYQLHRGDYRCVDSRGEVTNIEVKCFHTVWDGLLVELLQCATPLDHAARYRSLGWLANLHDCDLLIVGYHSDSILAYAYEIDFRRLRNEWETIMREAKRLRGIRYIDCFEGFGLTINVVLRWDILTKAHIATAIYPVRNESP